MADFDPAALLERAGPNPISAILALADTLQLTDEQLERLQLLADSLDVRRDSLLAELRQRAPAGRRDGNPMELFREVQPLLEEARASSQAALREAERLLTPEQWSRLPAQLREPPTRGGRGGRRS